MIVLHWLTITPSKLQTFVANRVAVIQKLTQKFSSSPDSQLPETIITVSADDLEISAEIKKCFVVSAPNDLFTYIQNHSEPHKLFHAIAYVFRFIHNASTSSYLTLAEIDEARLATIRLMQWQFFPNDYKHLEKRIDWTLPPDDFPKVQRTSCLKSLDPFMNKNRSEWIRVGGRLDACPKLSFDQKHPIVLPQCPFSTAIVKQIDNKNLHSGPSATLSFVREQYWPLKAPSTIRSVLKCYPSLRQMFPSQTSSSSTALIIFRWNELNRKATKICVTCWAHIRYMLSKAGMTLCKIISTGTKTNVLSEWKAIVAQMFFFHDHETIVNRFDEKLFTLVNAMLSLTEWTLAFGCWTIREAIAVCNESAFETFVALLCDDLHSIS